MLQDHVYIEEIAHFDRERIPERVVHAKGAGAFGYFEVTHDITKYCKVSTILCGLHLKKDFIFMIYTFYRLLYFPKLESKHQLLVVGVRSEENLDQLTRPVTQEVYKYYFTTKSPSY